MLTILTEAGKKHDKPIALTETGLEGIPDSFCGGQGLCCLSLRNIPSVMYWFGVMRVKSPLIIMLPIPDKYLPMIL